MRADLTAHEFIHPGIPCQHIVGKWRFQNIGLGRGAGRIKMALPQWAAEGGNNPGCGPQCRVHVNAPHRRRKCGRPDRQPFAKRAQADGPAHRVCHQKIGFRQAFASRKRDCRRDINLIGAELPDMPGHAVR